MHGAQSFQFFVKRDLLSFPPEMISGSPVFVNAYMIELAINSTTIKMARKRPAGQSVEHQHGNLPSRFLTIMAALEGVS